MTELEIKILIVKQIMLDHTDFVIAAEFPFQFGERRADIALLESEKLIAFEIKGAQDNTDRLSYQIKSYKKYFDFCYVICEPENLKDVRKNTPHEIGICVAKEKCIVKVRKSKLFKKLDKFLLTSTLSTSTLRKLSSKKLRSNVEMCEHVSKTLKLDEIKKISRREFESKYQLATNLFKMEASKSINPDDLVTITKAAPKKLRKRVSTQ
ncbi:sce7726 family protein [Billgrantia endophytica]|uniref:Protein cII n=1 Tax=Billgrantia endophytica TaxID=2033802 RepID=A0A2N7TW43_9GAMM|nr:sce7726 family protein [Halomonas endophytica]PMR72397.1 protein cII [Halomonas endophytica]